jgi:hypothetical protein
MRFHFLLSALTIIFLPLASFAQSDRHPSNTEIEKLILEMRQDIPKLMQTGIYRDRRSLKDRQQREAFVKAWFEVDSAIAPFLGNWTAIEENLVIFPSPNRGEVCIIAHNLDEADFYMGRVIDGNLSTDTNLTLVLDSGFLVSTFVSANQAKRYEYANPRPLNNPMTSSYYTQYHPKIVEQFKRAGCLTGIPK